MVPISQVKVGVCKGVLIHSKRLIKILIMNKILKVTFSDYSEPKFIVDLRVGCGVQGGDAALQNKHRVIPAGVTHSPCVLRAFTELVLVRLPMRVPFP